MSNEKQIIEEMARKMCRNYQPNGNCASDGDPCELECIYGYCAERIYCAGYRKQSEGEWIYDFTLDDDDFYVCSVCGRVAVVNGLCSERSPAIHYPYCNCGAKMKDGE